MPGARYSAAAGSQDCEFALAVVDDWQRLGLARRLLGELIPQPEGRLFFVNAEPIREKIRSLIAEASPRVVVLDLERRF